MVRVGISGFGRISRVVMRAAMDMEDVEIAGINWRKFGSGLHRIHAEV